MFSTQSDNYMYDCLLCNSLVCISVNFICTLNQNQLQLQFVYCFINVSVNEVNLSLVSQHSISLAGINANIIFVMLFPCLELNIFGQS